MSGGPQVAAPKATLRNYLTKHPPFPGPSSVHSSANQFPCLISRHPRPHTPSITTNLPISAPHKSFQITVISPSGFRVFGVFRGQFSNPNLHPRNSLRPSLCPPDSLHSLLPLPLRRSTANSNVLATSKQHRTGPDSHSGSASYQRLISG